MELTKIVYGLVSLVVAVLIIATVAIPVVNDAQNSQVTEYNNSVSKFVVTESSDDVTLELDDTTGLISIDGVVDNQAPINTGIEKIWFMNGAFRLLYYDEGYHWVAVEASENGLVDHSSLMNKIVYEDGVISAYKFTDDTLSFSAESDFLLYPCSTGTYGLYVTNESTNYLINNSSEIWIGSQATNYALFHGTKDNISQVGLVARSTYDSVTLDLIVEESDNGLTWKPSVNSSMTFSDSTNTNSDLTDKWLQIIVPISYLGISEDNSIARTLLGIIPLILILIPVLCAARMVTGGRD